MPMNTKNVFQSIAVAVLISILVLSMTACAPAEGSGVSEVLPSSYDMREKGIVTPVKDQNMAEMNDCYAFASVSAAETAILSAMGKTYEEYPIDLSEKHTSWFAYHPVTEADDPLQAGEGIFSEDVVNPEADINSCYRNGGLACFATALYASGAGPAPEEEYPYQGNNRILSYDFILTNESAWRDNYKKSLLRQGMITADTPEETANALVEKGYQRALNLRAQDIGSSYYAYDDWSIPYLDETGKSNRNKHIDFYLQDANYLPEPSVADVTQGESNIIREWKGLNEEGMRAMKSEILNGHAVVIGYCGDPADAYGEGYGDYLNTQTWANYVFEDESAGHAVCIVGWNDNYPAENFTHDVMKADGSNEVDKERTALTTPPANGAWLVKNSYGSETDSVPDATVSSVDGKEFSLYKNEWGIENEDGKHTGYFWLSYYDKTIVTPLTMSFAGQKDGKETITFQYDYLPFFNYGIDPVFKKEGVEKLAMANVFTADTDCSLTSVASFAPDAGCTISFTVYKLNDNMSDPCDGEKAAQISQVFDYAGYHRIDLKEAVSLTKGERFSVVVEVSRKADDGTLYYSVSAPRESSSYSRAVVHAGESFLYQDGVWTDWHDVLESGPVQKETEENGLVIDNFGIKAFCQ